MARRESKRSQANHASQPEESHVDSEIVKPQRVHPVITLLLFVGLAGLGFFLVVAYGSKNRRPESPLPEPVFSQAYLDEIQTIYRDRYAAIVTCLNANPCEQQEARSELDRVLETYDSQHDRFFQGILQAWLQVPERAADRLTSAAEGLALPPVDPWIANRFDTLQLERDEFYGATFTKSDCQYLWQSYVFQRLADRITEGCQSDREKADRLLDWVYRHVIFDEPELFNLKPLDIVLRGYGLCDRSVWIFTLLADRAGLATGIAMVGAPNPVDSTHTVCLVQIDGRWLVCDTTQGIFIQCDGRDADILELIRKATRQKESDHPDRYIAPFLETIIAISFDADGIPPRMALLNPYFKLMLARGNVYESISVKREKLNTVWPERVQDGTWKPGVWGYPFIMRAESQSPKYRETWKEVFAPVLLCQPARLNQLFGQIRAATEIYSQLEQVIQASWKERCGFLRAQSFYDGGDMKQADAAFIDFLRRYPSASWKEMAILHLARCKVALGDIENAKQLYQSIDTLDLAKRDLERLKQPRQSKP